MEVIYNDSEGSENDDDSVSTILRVKENDPYTTQLERGGTDADDIQNMTDVEWEELGRDISNNTHLRDLDLNNSDLNDHKMAIFFRGLTRSSSVEQICLYSNEFSAAGVHSMVPFLQNAYNLIFLDLSGNNFQSEGFNTLLRALQNSPVKELSCDGCGIESIEENIPQNLTELHLDDNIINADGCRRLATLLQGGDSALTHLYLNGNKIGDEGVEILVDALQNNKSLEALDLRDTDGISKRGQIMLLKLVNDISSIKATLQSNHTLKYISVDPRTEVDPLATDLDIEVHINMVAQINQQQDNPEVAGWMKIIDTQLHSGKRAELAKLQGVSHSVYSEINPLHLPEVLALVGKHHGHGELYVALKSSIAGVISTVNRKQCVQQQIAHYSAKIAEYRAKLESAEAELATMEAAEGHVVDMGSESPRSGKRRRS